MSKCAREETGVSAAAAAGIAGGLYHAVMPCPPPTSHRRDCKWFERADDMYGDFAACRSVLSTPIPFAVRRGGLVCARGALAGGAGSNGALPPCGEWSRLREKWTS